MALARLVSGYLAEPSLELPADAPLELLVPFTPWVPGAARRGAARVARRGPLNLGGFLDFVGAVATGVLTSNSSLGFFAPTTPMPSMGMLPLSLIPTFMVPLWIIVHFASLLQLR